MQNWLALAALLTLFGFAPSAYADGVQVKNSWARASIGMERPGVVYMTIHNLGDQSDRLLSLTTPVAEQALLHETVRQGDAILMRAIKSINLPPGATVSLEPGGLHVMLISLRKQLLEGESFFLTLNFAKARKVTVDVNISGIAAKVAPTTPHDHRDKHNHD